MSPTSKSGRLEVICGPMFSGKSEELIRRLRRSQLARQKTQIFKHSADNRRTLDHVASHCGDRIAACAIAETQTLAMFLLDDTEVIGIDEVQFFGNDIVLLIDKLVDEGKRVIVAGLDLDFRGIPFGSIPTLMALADEVIKLKAVCMKTGADAHYSQRLVSGQPALHTDPLVLIGAEESYEARSRATFEIDRKPLAEYLKRHNFE
ncbi:MAG: thymidine kinase [Candidatus Babeliaceae bacterium]|nr:thymidine kinase [Candidatus Babeliaceae bacterium]